ncbi:Ig-like domain-containing protein, partial [Vibrio fluminensis]|uniref:Ig-like domain-containing protein n=1 Tax=Vibrio fluminensis TaxID=2783614 RepID=UPI0018874F4C
MGLEAFITIGNLAFGQSMVIDVNGSLRILAPGERPKEGEVLVTNHAVAEVDAENRFEVSLYDDAETPTDITDDVAQIFGALEAGQDPTQIDDAFSTAAGTEAGSSIGNAASLVRTSNETMAETSFSTEGLESLGLSRTQSLSLLEQFRAVNQDSSTINNLPVGEDVIVTIDEDSEVRGQLNATDADSEDVLTYEQETLPENGKVVVNPDGSWVYTPNEFFNGQDSFTVQVSDGKGGTDTITITVDVTPVHGTPIISIPEADENGFINADESADGIQVVVDLPQGTGVGDTIELSDKDGNLVGTHIVSRDDLLSDSVTIDVPTPDDGSYTYHAQITDPQGNKGPVSNDASYTLDTVAPGDGEGPQGSDLGPVVEIKDDTNNDGLISKDELGNDQVQVEVSVNHDELTNGGHVTLTVNGGDEVLLKLVDGKLVTLTDEATDYQYDNGTISWTETAPAEGGNITVTATQTDKAGNESAQGSDSAQLDTVAPGDGDGDQGSNLGPMVEIKDDGNNDGLISKDELGNDQVQVEVSVNHDELTNGGHVTLTVNGGDEVQLKLV